MTVTFRQPIVSLKDDKIVLRCSYEDKELAKSIPGWRWLKEYKAWGYPIRPEIAKDIKRLFPDAIFDSSVTQAVGRIEERERAVFDLKNQETVDVELPVLVKPFDHQKKAFAIGTVIPHVALLMEPGCGKTLTAIAIAGYWWKYEGLRRMLIVAPKSVVPVWPDEFRQYAAYPTDVRVLAGDSSEKVEILQSFPAPGDALQVAVVNYESTWRIEETLAKWIRGGMIVADESQRIKNPGAEQSKAMHRLGPLASHRAILTGTPGMPHDYYSQYKFLDPSIFGKSYTAFKARYAVMGGFENKKIVEYKRIDEFVRKAHSIAFRITKAEALDLPPWTNQYRYVELSDRARRVYDEIRKESIAELLADEQEKGVVKAEHVLTKILRLQQVTGGFVKDTTGHYHQVDDSKLNELEELLDDLLTIEGKKVVVFAIYIEELQAIRALLEKKGIGYRYIMGEVSQQDRGQAVKDFQTDPNVRAFVAQTRTAGLGVTLTAADTAIFYSYDYKLDDYEQSRDRINRIGQTKPITYIYLVAEKTIDDKIIAALKEKKDIAKTVADDWRNYF